MLLGLKSYSQWFEGIRNEVLGTHSCDKDRSNNKLTHIIKTVCPSQVPSYFKIQQLPNKITLWLTALLLKLLIKVQLFKVHTRSKLRHGVTGKNTWTPLGSKMMTTSKTYLGNSNIPSSEHLHWLSWKQGFQNHLMNNWLQEQSAVPFSMFVQPSETWIPKPNPWQGRATCIYSSAKI